MRIDTYMRLPGELPIVNVNFEYKNRNSDTAGFIVREIEDFDVKTEAEPKVLVKETIKTEVLKNQDSIAKAQQFVKFEEMEVI